MSSFAELLRARREHLGFTRAGLSKLADISADYIVELEGLKSGRTKTPSIEKLKNLAAVLAARSQEQAADVAKSLASPPWHELDRPEAARLILSLFDIDVRTLGMSEPKRIQSEISAQLETPRGGEIWIISDTLAELQIEDFAESTAENVMNRDVGYRYFVPHSRIDDAKDAIQAIRSHLPRESVAELPSEQDRAHFDSLVALYDMCEAAFFARLRISQPGTNEVNGHYILGGSSASAAEPKQAPAELVVRAVDVVSRMLARADSGRPIPAELGSLKRVEVDWDTPEREDEQA